MALQLPNFKRISFDEANPMLVGMERGQKLGQSFASFPQELKAKILANKIAEAQAKYAEPMAAAGLKTAQQHNMYDPRIWESEIGLRGATSGKLSTETKMNNLKMDYLAKVLRGQQGGTQSGGGFGGGPSPGMGQAGYGGNEQPGMGVGGGGASGQMQGNDAETGMQGAGGGGYGGTMGQAASRPQPTVYGIPTPTPTPDDIANQMLLGIDTFTPRRENAKLQQEDQYKQHQESLANSIKAANGATAFNQALGMFNNAMDRSTYKGSALGNIPSAGIVTAGLGNVSAEQQADRAAMNMLPSAIETLKDSMGQARFSNLDMGMAAKMKFDRTMDDKTRALQTQWIGAVHHRMQEKSKFLSLVSNPQSGLTNNQAEQLWQSYQEDLPLISQDGAKVKNSNLDKWWFYTTPKAVESLKKTGSYHISKAELDTIPMRLPNNSVYPIKKSMFAKAFKDGARPL